MSIEEKVSRHYGHGGNLKRAILDGLAALGKDPEHIATADLAAVDEFHTGGREATVEIAAALGAHPAMRLLDLGSGIGGPARFFAETHGCHVIGIELTEEFVHVAETLTRRTGLAEHVTFRQGSVLELPFPPASFDAATLIHVGMNIADKRGLFAEVRKALVTGGLFVVYDMMRLAEGELRYPVPWAKNAETSFLASLAQYRTALERTGFTILAERERRQFALEFFARRRAAAAAEGGPPALSFHLILGPDFAQKIANLTANIEDGLLAPCEIVARSI